MPITRLRTFCLFFALLIPVLPSGAQSPLPPAKLDLRAIREGIRDHERRIRTLHYQGQVFMAVDPTTTAFPVRPFSECRVWWNHNFDISIDELWYGPRKQAGETVASLSPKPLLRKSWNHQRLKIYSESDNQATISDARSLRLAYDSPVLTHFLGYSIIYYRPEYTLGETIDILGAKFIAVQTGKNGQPDSAVIEVTVPSSPFDGGRPTTESIVRLWIAPSLQYSPIRIEASHYPQLNVSIRVWEIVEHASIDGVVLPVRIKAYVKNVPPKARRSFRGQEYRFFNIVLNKPIHPHIFDLSIPPGTRVRDEITTKTHIMRN